MIREALLTPNPYSRPQIPMGKVQAVAMHWVASPGASAMAVRNYFESLKTGSLYASAHYAVDSKEIVRAVPDTEVAYHIGSLKDKTAWADAYFGGEAPNHHAIGVELTHPDWSGAFSEIVLARATLLVAYLCLHYDLDPMHAVITHNAVSQKDCPRFWVAHPECLEAFRVGVRNTLEA